MKQHTPAATCNAFSKNKSGLNRSNQHQRRACQHTNLHRLCSSHGVPLQVLPPPLLKSGAAVDPLKRWS